MLTEQGQPISLFAAYRRLISNLHSRQQALTDRGMASLCRWGALGYIVFPFVIIACCYVDGTLDLGDEGRGLVQHYGYWTIFTTTPAILLVTGHLLVRFCATLEDLTRSRARTSKREAHSLKEAFEYHTDSICLRSRSQAVFALAVLVGLMYFLINVIEMYDPVPTYGHEVFDSWDYKWGYWATKIYLLPLFTAVYPLSIFVAIHVTVSVALVIKNATKADWLPFRIFHRDGCGGLSRFGYLNLLVMVIYAFLLLVLLGMFLTHDRTYFVTRSALIFCSAVLLLQSVIGVEVIRRFAKAKKNELLDSVGNALECDLTEGFKAVQFDGDLLLLRRHIQNIHTLPYASRVRFLVNALRFVPAMIAIASLFLPL